jgi:hypothetical protein
LQQFAAGITLFFSRLSTGARYLFVDEAAGLPVAEATQLLRTGKRVILATTLDGGWAKFRHDRSDRSAWAHEGPTGMAQLRIIKA